MLRSGGLWHVPLRDVAVEICYMPSDLRDDNHECRRGNMLRAGDLWHVPLRDVAVEICYVPVTCDTSRYETPPLKHAMCQ